MARDAISNGTDIVLNIMSHLAKYSAKISEKFNFDLFISNVSQSINRLIIVFKSIYWSNLIELTFCRCR